MLDRIILYSLVETSSHISPDTQNGFAILEALSEDVSVESLGRNFDGVSAHTGMKVRPSTKGNIPSALQLLPGQSFYLGKTTLSLVPEEHRDLPIHSSGLPDSDFESYNHQVSQLSTPQRTARASSTVMETPMPQKDHSSEVSTPILERITGHAISGRSDSNKCPESPLKREVMRTVRDVTHLGYSELQPEIKEGKKMADATINEPSHSYLQPEITVGHDTTDADSAKPLEGRVVNLEDPKTADIDLGSNFPEKSDSSPLKSPVHQETEPEGPGNSCNIGESERLSPSGVHVRPDEEAKMSNHSRILAGSMCLQSPVEQVQPKKRRQTSDESSSQGEDDPDDAPVRKKARTGTILHEAVSEESQDSRQDEVVFVREDQASSTFRKPSTDTGVRSNTLDQPIQGFLTPSAGLKHVGPTASPEPQPHPANRPHFKSSFSSAKSKPQTPVSRRNTVSASSSNSVEPNSSMRSTRSTAREGVNNSSLTDAGIRIVFASSSTAGESKPFMKFLSSKGVKKVKSVHDCTVLCVGKELKKTSKVILAVLLGKDIVTDSWVTNSVKGNDLLSIVPYLARDPKTEADWGISLEQAIFRGKKGLKVLQDYTIHFTPSAKKELGSNGFDEVKEIVKCAGARSVFSSLPKKSPEDAPSTIVVATPDGKEVADLQKLGWKAYTKDIISLSVLRGKLDLESDEFLINDKEQDKGSNKRKR